jgi:hypothetical protein
LSKPNLIKRIEKLERPSTDPRWKVAIYDESTGFYTGPDFTGSLTPEQFKKWVAAQDRNTQVIIVEILENKPKLIIENYAAKNTEDLLREYEELIRESVKTTDEIAAKSFEKENGEKPCQDST